MTFPNQHQENKKSSHLSNYPSSSKFLSNSTASSLQIDNHRIPLMKPAPTIPNYESRANINTCFSNSEANIDDLLISPSLQMKIEPSVHFESSFKSCGNLYSQTNQLKDSLCQQSHLSGKRETGSSHTTSTNKYYTTRNAINF